MKKRHEDRRGQRRQRPWNRDSSSEPSKKPSKFGKLVYSSTSSGIEQESNSEKGQESSEGEASGDEILALKVLLKPGSSYPTKGSMGAAGSDVTAAQTLVVLARQI